MRVTIKMLSATLKKFRSVQRAEKKTAIKVCLKPINKRV